MKQAIKYLVVFLLGAGLAIAICDIFLPPNIIVTEGIRGPAPAFTLEDFETINSEFSSIPGHREMNLAIAPYGSSGYQIRCSDLSLKARFGFVNFDEAIRLVQARMEELRGESIE